MDKSCRSSADSSITSSSTTTSDSNKDPFLKALHTTNKLSHKISKPNTNNNTILQKKPSFDNNPSFSNSSSINDVNNTQVQTQQQNQQQHQPPVYNINKNDFRDVVQKLTGSPAHERYSTPPPIHPPKPQSSRLQRIRPPPLDHVHRPSPSLNSGPPPFNGPLNLSMPIQRPPAAPLSPLPPFPTVHSAADSPVSAYMRYLQNTMGAGPGGADKQFSGFSPLAPLVSPRWNNLVPPLQQQQPFPPPPIMASSSNPPPLPQFQLPTSPLPFGCLNSPRSAHPLLSPGLLMSPTAFPLSPTLQVPSPIWRNL